MLRISDAFLCEYRYTILLMGICVCCALAAGKDCDWCIIVFVVEVS